MTSAALVLVAAFLSAPLMAGAPAVSTSAVSDRPGSWAQPLDRPGLPNLFKVSDSLYRGAQPKAEGFEALKDMGVKTVINLRSDHTDAGKLPPGMEYVSIPMSPFKPKEADVIRFLRVVADQERGPFFLHCARGADRTGFMAGAYRIAVQGWDPEEAVREMREGGFGHAPLYKSLGTFLLKLDVERARDRAGINERSGKHPAAAER